MLEQSAQRSRIFLSYARKDGRRFAAWLRRQLKSNGLSVWHDVVDIHAGEDWWLHIEDQIRLATAFVLVLTPAALDSPVVGREWAYARRTGTAILPLADCDPVITSAPHWLKKADFIDLGSEHPDHAANWERFLGQARNPPPCRPSPFMAEPLPAYVAQRERATDLANHFLDEAPTNPRNTKVILYGQPGIMRRPRTLSGSGCVEAFPTLRVTLGGLLSGAIPSLAPPRGVPPSGAIQPSPSASATAPHAPIAICRLARLPAHVQGRVTGRHYEFSAFRPIQSVDT